MPKVILEKIEGFNKTWDNIKKGLESFFGREFETFENLRDEIYSLGLPRVYFPKKHEMEIPSIPFIVREWPLYGPESNMPLQYGGGEFPIAIAKLK